MAMPPSVSPGGMDNRDGHFEITSVQPGSYVLTAMAGSNNGPAQPVQSLPITVVSSDIEGIVLRYGFFYGPGTWFNPDGDVAKQVRQQQFPIIGNGEGVWSWLHVEDAAIATVAAAEQGNPGIYLIANDQPLAVREWLPAFARWLNAPPRRDAMRDSRNTSSMHRVE